MRKSVRGVGFERAAEEVVTINTFNRVLEILLHWSTFNTGTLS